MVSEEGEEREEEGEGGLTTGQLVKVMGKSQVFAKGLIMEIVPIKLT